ncbi:hypothetical protein V7095_07525 [Bacillus thuringiensis]|nr:hypothetical protein [Bacillus thuringiensis]
MIYIADGYMSNKMDAYGNGGGSRNQHGNIGGSPLKEHGKGI